MSNETYIDFIKFIKDYSLLIQDKNLKLDAENKQILNFNEYQTYYNYRKKL